MPSAADAFRNASTTPASQSMRVPYALPELLGKRNDNALRAADVAEPVHVLKLSDFAYELSAMGAQAREDILNVVDGEHDATYAQRVYWCVLRFNSDRRRRVELVQLKSAVAVRSPHHRNLASNVLEANDTVHPAPLDGHLALQLHPKFDKERLRSLKVLDHDENVVHSFERHVLPSQGHRSCHTLSTDERQPGLATDVVDDLQQGRMGLVG